MSKRKPSTVLDDFDPPSEEEWRAFQEKRQAEWFDRVLPQLLAYHDLHPKYGKKICSAIISKFGRDNELSKMLRSHLTVERSGKPRGKPRLTKAQHIQILMHYAHLDNQIGREKALDQLAEKYCIGVNRIERRITAARKVVTEVDLPPWAVPWLTPRNKKNRGSDTGTR